MLDRVLDCIMPCHAARNPSRHREKGKAPTRSGSALPKEAILFSVPEGARRENVRAFLHAPMPGKSKKRPPQNSEGPCFIFGDPPGTRTPNPLIKSQMLYQLS